ncbi:hypothetical protein Tigna_02257 [Tepidimonas ignava]|uniref:Secreted protein n=1 Tax=Tepidimonas ignava TaxID=114249 RepID=A0ABY3DFM9_9BURK|nr:hypothetical protein Tigna_02257 [Tepidimonas ignava]
MVIRTLAALVPSMVAVTVQALQDLDGAIRKYPVAQSVWLFVVRHATLRDVSTMRRVSELLVAPKWRRELLSVIPLAIRF